MFNNSSVKQQLIEVPLIHICLILSNSYAQSKQLSVVLFSMCKDTKHFSHSQFFLAMSRKSCIIASTFCPLKLSLAGDKNGYNYAAGRGNRTD